MARPRRRATGTRIRWSTGIPALLLSIAVLVGGAGIYVLISRVPSLSSAVVVRGIYGHDASASGWDAIGATGFNVVTVGAYRDALDTVLEAGLQGVVWLGEYHRTSSCDFEFSDEKVRRLVSEVAGHPAIAAYFLADEPSYARVQGCPSAPDDLKRRSDLVHSLDPGIPTVVTLTTWDGVESFAYEPWVGTADIFGLVVYPCFQGSCDFSLIDEAISEAAADGLGEYWAIVQDFADSWYDLPDPDELDEQFSRWSRSEMTGYLVFAARGFACCQPSDFESNDEKATTLESWNRS